MHKIQLHKLLLATLMLASTLPLIAQAPKWQKKVRKAQITVQTFDQQGKLLHSTNGFFIDAQGNAVSDYSSFRGAASATVVDNNGRQYAVTRICGANSLYDVVRFKVDIKKNDFLTTASSNAKSGDLAIVLPSLNDKDAEPTQAIINDIQTFNEIYAYYTLPITLSEQSTSCPVMNEAGEVLGLWQMSATRGDEKSFAVSATYATSLSTNALSANNNDLREILIPKALPDDAAQASSFIYLLGTRDTSLYLSYVTDFIAKFPSETNGYTMKAEMLAGQGKYNDADAVWMEGLKAKAAADEIHYSHARSIYAAAQGNKSLPQGWTLDDAISEIAQAKEANPLPLYTAMEGHILYAQQKYADAAARFEQVCTTNLRSSEHFLYAAQCHQMQNDTLGALAMQDSAVACYTKPYTADVAPALLMRASTLMSLQRYREAVADLIEYEYVVGSKLNSNFYYQRSQAAINCRMFQQALNDLEEAARLSPEEALFQAELAALHYRFGNHEEAEQAARKAIAIDKDFADAHRILSVCLKAQGKEVEARTELQQAAALGDEIARRMLEQ